MPNMTGQDVKYTEMSVVSGSPQKEAGQYLNGMKKIPVKSSIYQKLNEEDLDRFQKQVNHYEN